MRVCAGTLVINFSGCYPGILFLLFITVDICGQGIHPLTGLREQDSQQSAEKKKKKLNVEVKNSDSG